MTLTDEQELFVNDRLQRLLDPETGCVRMIPGVELTNISRWSFNVHAPSWKAGWLAEPGSQRGGADHVEWFDTEWGDDTVRAAADPNTPDRVVARLALDDVLVGLVEAVAHEFVEHAGFDDGTITDGDDRVWDAHPQGGVATLTSRALSRLDARMDATPLELTPS